MIKIEKTEVTGWPVAIRGMRNPYNSWDKSDSFYCPTFPEFGISDCPRKEQTPECPAGQEIAFCIGHNDLDLMRRLASAGTDHSKYLRMITVTADITAPLYWWLEYDTYKVGTVANSCSKMHKLLEKPFELSDFSFDKLPGFKKEEVARPLVDMLNELRDSWLTCDNTNGKKAIWYTLIQLLPESYNQRRTVQFNYQVAHRMHEARKNHKLDEWHVFCDWVETLPYYREIFWR